MSSLAHPAQQASATQQQVPSPCLSICVMATPGSQGPSQALCIGCFRTLEEVAQWAQFSDAEKRAVWVQLPQREHLARIKTGATS